MSASSDEIALDWLQCVLWTAFCRVLSFAGDQLDKYPTMMPPFPRLNAYCYNRITVTQLVYKWNETVVAGNLRGTMIGW